MDYNGADKEVEYELCVMCGSQTEVNVNTHIDERADYIVGAGQLCSRCQYTNKQYRVTDFRDFL
jgi:hypothetical protein